jgi:hypothetical protein
MAEHQSRLNDTLVRKRTDAKMRSDRMGGQRRRSRDEERARKDADNAARMAASAGRPPVPAIPSGHIGQAGRPGRVVSPAPRPGDIMSPSIRPGDIMSPGIQHPAMFPSGSFPRPPIPYQGWNGYSDTPQAGSGQRRGSGYTLQDTSAATPLVGTGPLPAAGRPGEDRRRAEEERRRKEKEPQTFAEMGFQSKPVEDEGCTIM